MIRFRKTHDLEQLLQSASSVEPGLLLLANAMTLLSEYSVRYRYPGVSALPKQAKAAVAAAKQVRIAILPLLKK